MWSVFAQFQPELVLAVNDLQREEKGREEEQQELKLKTTYRTQSLLQYFLSCEDLSVINKLEKEDYYYLTYGDQRSLNKTSQRKHQILC